MRNYELTLILAASLAEEQVHDIIQHISSFLQEKGGILGNQDIKGKKPLLAPIDRQTEGYVVVLKFTIAAEHIAPLEAELKENDQVLRHMLLIAPRYTKKTLAPRIATPAAVAATITTPIQTENAPALVKEQVSTSETSSASIDKKLEEIFNEE